METVYEKSLRLFDEYLNSDASNAYFEELRKKEEIETLRLNRVGNYLDSLSPSKLKKLVNRLIDEHTEELSNLWYSKGIMPMPTNKLQLIFDYLFSENSKSKKLKVHSKEYNKYATGFGDCIVKYKGYIFQQFFGQGVGHKIHKNGVEIFGGW